MSQMVEELTELSQIESGQVRLRLAPVLSLIHIYALRALLAIRWLEQYDSAPPMEFGGLLPLIGDNAPLSAAIEALLERKRRTNESDQEPLDETVAAFIRSELRRVDGLTPATAPREDVLPLLDGVFRAVLRET